MSFVAPFLYSGSLFSSAPGMLTIGWGERSWHSSVRASTLKSAQFYFPDFFLASKTPWCSHLDGCEIATDVLIEQLQQAEAFPPAAPLCWQAPCKEQFKSSYDSLQRLVRAGHLEKGVPYAFAVAKADMCAGRLKGCLLALLEALKEMPLYAYGFWDQQQGMLGATPELLFSSKQRDHRHIQSMACAATTGSSQSEQRGLLGSKEQHEHQLVITGMRESIAALGGELEVHQTMPLPLPLLTHLVTPLTATFPAERHFEQIATALHPTPALGAYPKEPGWHWLKEQQAALPRGRYGAPVGLLHPKGRGSTCAVAIRNMQWQANWIGLGAGCGVVSGSDFECEWQELQLKLTSIKKILCL
jgi:menaquinone-specific isochorismate synthase